MKSCGHIHVCGVLTMGKELLVGGLRVGLGALEERKIFYLCREFNHDSSVVHPVTPVTIMTELSQLL